MRSSTTTTAALAIAVLATLTACEDTTPSPQPPRTATTSPTPTTETDPGTLPDFVGKGLQYAQDEAQAAGFHRLTSHDALGRGRNQVLDRHWKVCSQDPAPGTHPTATTVDFATVKIEETCPAVDAGEPDASDGTMPDLVGKSVRVARQTLPSNTSISVRDNSGKDRMVLVESNWKICTIKPAAGAKLDGQPVVIGAVKYEESC